MKIHIILFCCLCKSLAVTVHYETAGSANTKEYKESLKDIRLVSVTKADTLQKPVLLKEQNDYFKQLRVTEQPKIPRQSLRKSAGEKRKTAVPLQPRTGDFSTGSSDSQAQMQKIANQLYLAQKRASLLSDYQKFIVSQDANIKTFVLGGSLQNRSPKPFSSKRPSGRSLSTQTKAEYVTSEPPTAESIDSGKIVAVTPKVQTAADKISKPQNDHKAQGTHIKYVTLAPQSLTHFVETRVPSQKVTLIPYHTPQPHTYYNLGETSKPQVEPIQIPTLPTASLGISYKSLQPQYHHNEDGHEDSQNYDDSNYEFMYKVKDYEKNNHFGHKEFRSDKTTYGYYFVQLPDGRLETVKYWADKTGYHAKVDYQGQAKHPTHADHKINSYNLVYH